jgi:hypothetical protein
MVISLRYWFKQIYYINTYITISLYHIYSFFHLFLFNEVMPYVSLTLSANRISVIACVYLLNLPARAPGRLALPVRHRLRLRRMPGRLGWRASLQWQAGLGIVPPWLHPVEFVKNEDVIII